MWLIKCWFWSTGYLSRNIAVPFFLRIPIVSFYSKTLLAIGILKSLPDTERTISGILYTSRLGTNDTNFISISKIIKTVYKVQDFDEIKFNRTEQHLTGLEGISNKPIFHGGECFIELFKNNKIQATLYVKDDEFSDIKRELDRIARKRLAIVVLIFGIAAVLFGIFK